MKIKLPTDIKMMMTWVLLLTPAVIFWTSALLYAGLGTDYLFDVVLEKLGESYLGNALVIFFVIGGPALTVVFTGREYLKSKNKRVKIGLILGGLFLLLGLFSLLKKY